MGIVIPIDAFSPARTLGMPHSAELGYLIRFVLVRPEEPLKDDERLVDTNSLSGTCPKPVGKYEIVVCRTAIPTRFKVLHWNSEPPPDIRVKLTSIQ